MNLKDDECGMEWTLERGVRWRFCLPQLQVEQSHKVDQKVESQCRQGYEPFEWPFHKADHQTLNAICAPVGQCRQREHRLTSREDVGKSLIQRDEDQDAKSRDTYVLGRRSKDRRTGRKWRSLQKGEMERLEVEVEEVEKDQGDWSWIVRAGFWDFSFRKIP